MRSHILYIKLLQLPQNLEPVHRWLRSVVRAQQVHRRPEKLQLSLEAGWVNKHTNVKKKGQKKGQPTFKLKKDQMASLPAVTPTATQVRLQHLLNDPNTFKPQQYANVVDRSFFFNAREYPELWKELKMHVQSSLQDFVSHASNFDVHNNDESIAVVDVEIDINPRSSVKLGDRYSAPQYVLSFRKLLTLKTGPAPAYASFPANTLQPVGQGDEAGRHNLTVILENAKNPQMIVSFAEAWINQNELYFGVVHPDVSLIPLVTNLHWAGNNLYVTIETHRNLPRGLRQRDMPSAPSTIYQSSCGQYLKLTYLQGGQTYTRYWKVKGGVPERVFPQPLPIFDLRELPEQQ
jgi:hypothetical protein